MPTCFIYSKATNRLKEMPTDIIEFGSATNKNKIQSKTFVEILSLTVITLPSLNSKYE